MRFFFYSMCHISTVVFPPSLEPTVSPTNYTSSAPTLPPAAYDDPVRETESEECVMLPVFFIQHFFSDLHELLWTDLSGRISVLLN